MIRLIIERERFHQLRLRALECICEALTAKGDYAGALEAALAAIAAEPLRESAHRALIGVHLAEGNRAEAVRQFGLRSDSARGIEPFPLTQDGGPAPNFEDDGSVTPQ